MMWHCSSCLRAAVPLHRLRLAAKDSSVQATVKVSVARPGLFSSSSSSSPSACKVNVVDAARVESVPV